MDVPFEVHVALRYLFAKRKQAFISVISAISTLGVTVGVMKLLVSQLNGNLLDRKLKIALTPEVIDWIIEATCKDRSYGARPLRRAIQRYVEDPLSEELIRGHLRGGDIEVFLDGGSLAYRPAGELEAGRKLV